MPIKAILVGAGDRGLRAYGPYALQNPDELTFVGVADPNSERRNTFGQEHSIAHENMYSSWEEMLNRPKFADAVLICTKDRMHFEPTMKALAQGYHVLLEKPMSYDVNELKAMDQEARKCGLILAVCHVLRYTEFFSKLKSILDEGKIGTLVSIQHLESVGYWHQAHSFVRGNWRRKDETSPMILAKCCHDMDILNFLVGARCVSVSSYGSLRHFKKENKPKGAPDRCILGCPHSDTCPYDATRQYLSEDIGWPTCTISDDTSMEARIKALKEGPYGRCVYACDNDVVDNQVVNLLYDSGVTVSMAMCAFTRDIKRTINIMGTKGQITGDMEESIIHVDDFVTGRRETIKIDSTKGGHSGGDYGLMKDFVRQVASNGQYKGLTSSGVSIQSHLMALAAEESRLTGKTIEIM